MFLPMQALSDQFREKVEAYLIRTGMTPAHLGRVVLGDPSFVLRLMRGRAPRLETADRLLVFMDEAPIGPGFRTEVNAFLDITRTKPYLFGQQAATDPSFVARLRRGLSPRLDTVQRVREWMDSNSEEFERIAIRAAQAELLGVGNENVQGNLECKKAINGEGEVFIMKDEPARYLDTREAAQYLGLSNRTLDRYRVTGEGPVFHKFGSRIRYAQADLEEWATARRMRSTSDDRRVA